MNTKDWWALIEPELDALRVVTPRRRGRRPYYMAKCPFHHGDSPSLRIDLDRGPGLWYCYGPCKRGGSLRELALQFGWEEGTDGPVRLNWLSPPYEFPRLQEGVPFELPVVAYEIGISKRPVDEKEVTRTTIRLHADPRAGCDDPSYYDFTNLSLIIDILDIYAALPGHPDTATVLRLIRRGAGLDTRYRVKVVRPRPQRRGLAAIFRRLFGLTS